jgi:hypothetical protein
MGQNRPLPASRIWTDGDYTGLDFFDGKLYPVWADNSNSTGDNPDGTLSRFDIYTAQVTLTLGPPLDPPGTCRGGDDLICGDEGNG